MNDVSELMKWLKSDEAKVAAKEFVEDLAFKEKIQQGRYDRFEKWLETNDFDKLIYKLILEHNDEYRERCYENGYEPKPNNKMDFIFSYVSERAGKRVHIKEFESDFPNAVWEFNGYYFEIVWGQGCIQVIYNKEDKKRIFSI